MKSILYTVPGCSLRSLVTTYHPTPIGTCKFMDKTSCRGHLGLLTLIFTLEVNHSRLLIPPQKPCKHLQHGYYLHEKIKQCFAFPLRSSFLQNQAFVGMNALGGCQTFIHICWRLVHPV